MALRQSVKSSAPNQEREKERASLIGAPPKPRTKEEMDYVFNNGNGD